MDPIFDLPADLPPHAAEILAPVSAQTVCEWPVGTFLENIAALSDGSLALAVHSENAVERISSRCDQLSKIEFPGPPAGLVARKDGGFYVAVGEPGTSPGRLWQVNQDGTKELAIEIADSLFLNGLTPLTEDSLLAAESILGRVYKLNLRTRRAEVWFASEALEKVTSFAFMPGANGIKVFDEYVYVTNTDRATIVKIKVEQDGSAGAVEPIADHLRGDDFAFGEDGSLYITTHIENSVVHLSPNGQRIAVAGPEQGMPGSTAIAFSRDSAHRSQAFVTTTGGLLRPYNRVAQPAKLIRLELPTPGAAIPFAI
jgi:hypothetical protein